MLNKENWHDMQENEVVLWVCTYQNNTYDGGTDELFKTFIASYSTNKAHVHIT